MDVRLLNSATLSRQVLGFRAWTGLYLQMSIPAQAILHVEGALGHLALCVIITLTCSELLPTLGPGSGTARARYSSGPPCVLLDFLSAPGLLAMLPSPPPV